MTCLESLIHQLNLVVLKVFQVVQIFQEVEFIFLLADLNELLDFADGIAVLQELDNVGLVLEV